MNRPLIAVAALGKKSVNDRVQLGEAIDAALTEHADVFKTPNPPQAELQAATTELHDAKMDADTGSMVGKQRLKKAEKEFARLVGVYLDYVNMVAQGDGVVIEQSGLQVSREAQRPSVTPAPTNGKITGTTSGQVGLSVDAVPNARAYVWLYQTGPVAPSADADWRYHCATTKARTTVDSLPSGVRVWARCAAVTSAGQGPWSDPISRIVL